MRMVRISAWYNEHTVPREWLLAEELPESTWGRLSVREGRLFLQMAPSLTPIEVEPAAPALVPPQTPFHLDLIPRLPLRMRMEYFYSPPLDNAEALKRTLMRSS